MRRDEGSWLSRALCAHMGPSLWYSSLESERKRAKEVCRRCPVRSQCLQDVMHWERNVTGWNRYGVAGGKDEQEREELAREWQQTG